MCDGHVVRRFAEVLARLAHSEEACYRMRVDASWRRHVPRSKAQMLTEWAFHDLGHIRQIAELVRARKYLTAAGPLGSSYNLKP